MQIIKYIDDNFTEKPVHNLGYVATKREKFRNFIGTHWLAILNVAAVAGFIGFNIAIGNPITILNTAITAVKFLPNVIAGLAALNVVKYFAFRKRYLAAVNENKANRNYARFLRSQKNVLNFQKNIDHAKEQNNNILKQYGGKKIIDIRQRKYLHKNYLVNEKQIARFTNQLLKQHDKMVRYGAKAGYRAALFNKYQGEAEKKSKFYKIFMREKNLNKYANYISDSQVHGLNSLEYIKQSVQEIDEQRKTAKTTFDLVKPHKKTSKVFDTLRQFASRNYGNYNKQHGQELIEANMQVSGKSVAMPNLEVSARPTINKEVVNTSTITEKEVKKEKPSKQMNLKDFFELANNECEKVKSTKTSTNNPQSPSGVRRGAKGKSLSSRYTDEERKIIESDPTKKDEIDAQKYEILSAKAKQKAILLKAKAQVQNEQVKTTNDNQTLETDGKTRT